MTPDGKQIDISFIYQKDEKGNDVLDKKGNKILTNINITISGKAINFSDNKIDMDKAVNDISKQLEKSFSGIFDGVTISTKANITVADSMDDVNDDDHLIVFAEAPFRIYGGANDYGGKVAFVDADFFTG